MVEAFLGGLNTAGFGYTAAALLWGRCLFQLRDEGFPFLGRGRHRVKHATNECFFPSRTMNVFLFVI